jgi:hypothetical protein
MKRYNDPQPTGIPTQNKINSRFTFSRMTPQVAVRSAFRREGRVAYDFRMPQNMRPSSIWVMFDPQRHAQTSRIGQR